MLVIFSIKLTSVDFIGRYATRRERKHSWQGLLPFSPLCLSQNGILSSTNTRDIL